MKSFSIIISIYKNDKPEFVKRAFESITVNQTVKPDEIVLVVDGPVPDELSDLIDTYERSKEFYFNVIRLPENKGLGNALRIGMERASNETIARMDSDDVALPNRSEKQIEYLSTNQECTIVGGQINEFIDEEDKIIGKREVPCSNEDIYSWIKERCPFNHMTVMFRKSKVMEVGNYLDWHFNEDYYLWIRMALAGCKFANLPDILVNVRVGKDMYARRGGWKYFKSEEGLQRYMLRHKLIGFPRYLFNVTGRFAIQVAMPNSFRGWIFQKLFRK